MDDNPSLDERTRERYRSMYSGVFYERYILGRWVMAEGLIYDMMDTTANTYRPQDAPVGFKSLSTRTITCDYGTTNRPSTSMYTMTERKSGCIGNTGGTAARNTGRKQMKSMPMISWSLWGKTPALPLLIRRQHPLSQLCASVAFM